MANRIFTLRDWKRIKRDIFDDFFIQHDSKYDLQQGTDEGVFSEELMSRLNLKSRMGSQTLGEEIPEEQVEGGI